MRTHRVGSSALLRSTSSYLGPLMLLATAASWAPGRAWAQAAPTPNRLPITTEGDQASEIVDEDVVVTARKRSETSIANLDGLASVTPQPILASQAGSIQGGNVSIRGISGPDSLILADQAVAFNINGVAVSKSGVRRLSSTDLAQIEVLKGPQALFYGKIGPGGVVSITTADPADHLEVGGTIGYEFAGREVCADGHVSVPLSDTAGIRLSGYLRLAPCNGMRDRQSSEEKRLASRFNGPIDFVVGAFYGNSYDRAYSLNTIQSAANLAAYTPVRAHNIIQRGAAYPVFAQLIVKPGAQFEIDLRGRYSQKVKRIPSARLAPAGATSLDLTLLQAVFPPARYRIVFEDFSPEVTVSYRPTADLTLFASYNHAECGRFDNAPCFVGETPVQGCSLRTINGTTANYQSLGGTTLVRAPRWTLGAGLGYESPVGGPCGSD